VGMPVPPPTQEDSIAALGFLMHYRTQLIFETIYLNQKEYLS
jgi:hypothetical protein